MEFTAAGGANERRVSASSSSSAESKRMATFRVHLASGHGFVERAQDFSLGEHSVLRGKVMLEHDGVEPADAHGALGNALATRTRSAAMFWRMRSNLLASVAVSSPTSFSHSPSR